MCTHFNILLHVFDLFSCFLLPGHYLANRSFSSCMEANGGPSSGLTRSLSFQQKRFLEASLSVLSNEHHQQVVDNSRGATGQLVTFILLRRRRRSNGMIEAELVPLAALPDRVGRRRGLQILAREWQWSIFGGRTLERLSFCLEVDINWSMWQKT